MRKVVVKLPEATKYCLPGECRENRMVVSVWPGGIYSAHRRDNMWEFIDLFFPTGGNLGWHSTLEALINSAIHCHADVYEFDNTRDFALWLVKNTGDREG